VRGERIREERMGGERVWGDGTLRGDVPASGTMVCGDAAEVLFLIERLGN